MQTQPLELAHNNAAIVRAADQIVSIGKISGGIVGHS